LAYGIVGMAIIERRTKISLLRKIIAEGRRKKEEGRSSNSNGFSD